MLNIILVPALIIGVERPVEVAQERLPAQPESSAFELIGQGRQAAPADLRPVAGESDKCGTQVEDDTFDLHRRQRSVSPCRIEYVEQWAV